MPTISLTVGPTTVTLPADLQWLDEHSFSPVVGSVEPSLTGAALAQFEALQYRPITLAPASDDASWLLHEQVQQLRAWAAIPGQVMALALRGGSYSVVWRHHEPPAFAPQPLVPSDEPQAGDYYLPGTLRFTTL